jgi:hypothetical protein
MKKDKTLPEHGRFGGAFSSIPRRLLTFDKESSRKNEVERNKMVFFVWESLMVVVYLRGAKEEKKNRNPVVSQ